MNIVVSVGRVLELLLNSCANAYSGTANTYRSILFKRYPPSQLIDLAGVIDKELNARPDKTKNLFKSAIAGNFF